MLSRHAVHVLVSSKSAMSFARMRTVTVVLATTSRAPPARGPAGSNTSPMFELACLLLFYKEQRIYNSTSFKKHAGLRLCARLPCRPALLVVLRRLDAS